MATRVLMVLRWQISSLDSSKLARESDKLKSFDFNWVRHFRSSSSRSPNTNLNKKTYEICKKSSALSLPNPQVSQQCNLMKIHTLHKATQKQIQICVDSTLKFSICSILSIRKDRRAFWIAVSYTTRSYKQLLLTVECGKHSEALRLQKKVF